MASASLLQTNLSRDREDNRSRWDLFQNAMSKGNLDKAVILFLNLPQSWRENEEISTNVARRIVKKGRWSRMDGREKQALVQSESVPSSLLASQNTVQIVSRSRKLFIRGVIFLSINGGGLFTAIWNKVSKQFEWNKALLTDQINTLRFLEVSDAAQSQGKNRLFRDFIIEWMQMHFDDELRELLRGMEMDLL